MNANQPLTERRFMEVMNGVNSTFEKISEQFARINDRFTRIDDNFVAIHKKLREHDELLEVIAAEVSGAQDRYAHHEVRITRLERSVMKLSLKAK